MLRVKMIFIYWLLMTHRFHEVRALRALMHAARALRENGDDM